MSCISKSATVIVLGNLSAPTLFRRRPPIRCKSKKSSRKECKGPKKPLMNLQCKVALITGGAEGIGLAIAHQILGQKMKGIGIVGLNTCQGRDTVNKLNCCYGKNKAMFVRADIACPSQLAETFKKVKEEYGRLDVVVNCAGIVNGKEWEKEMSTNLAATIRSTLMSYKHLSKDPSSSAGGVILNISGTHGLQPLPPAPTLCCNYHGIVGMSKSFGDSLNFKRTGVRVVCLCPGITHSNFFKDADKKVLEPALFKDLQTVFRMSKQQKTDACGKAALHVLLHGPTGSVWVVEGSKLYSLKIPHWKDYSRLESQFI